MNGWEAGLGALGSIMQYGGAAASSYQAEEYKNKAALAKAKALENLRRQGNREQIDYVNSLKTGGVDPESGLPRSNKWIAENPDSNVVGVEKYKLDNREMKDTRTPLQKNAAAAGMSVVDWQKLKGGNGNSGQMSKKDQFKALTDYSQSAEYLDYLAGIDAENTKDTNGWWPGGSVPEGQQQKPLSPVEHMKVYAPERYDIVFGGDKQGGLSQNSSTRPGQVAPQKSDPVSAAVQLITSGERDFNALEKELGKTRPDFVEQVRKALPAERRPDIKTMVRKSAGKNKSNPAKWNDVMSRAFEGATAKMKKAANFQVNPAEITGKFAGGAAQAAADNVPGFMQKASKWGKVAYNGLSDAARAVVAANKNLSDKLTTVTTEKDARKVMAEIMKVVDAKSYDYGTGYNEGDVLEPRPL